MSPTFPSFKEQLLQTGRLAVKVTPKARQPGIGGMNDAGELLVKVAAAPEDGKANAAVIALLAQALGLPASTLEIAKGSTGRHKIVAYRPRKA